MSHESKIDGLTTELAQIALDRLVPEYPHKTGPFVFDKPGRRFVRIFRWSGSARSARDVVCFVERATGALHHADSWKKVGSAQGRTIFDLSQDVTRAREEIERHERDLRAWEGEMWALRRRIRRGHG